MARGHVLLLQVRGGQQSSPKVLEICAGRQSRLGVDEAFGERGGEGVAGRGGLVLHPKHHHDLHHSNILTQLASAWIQQNFLPLAFTLPDFLRSEMTSSTPHVDVFGIQDTFEALLDDDEVDTLAQITPRQIRKVGMLVKSWKFDKLNVSETGRFVKNVVDKPGMVKIEYCGKILTMDERDVIVAEKNIDDAILPVSFTDSAKKAKSKIKVGTKCRAMWDGRGKVRLSMDER